MTLILLLVVIAGGILCFWMLVGIASDNTEIMNALALMALRRDLQDGRVTEDPSGSADSRSRTGIMSPAGASRASQPAGPDAYLEPVECPACYGILENCGLCHGKGVILIYDEPKSGAR